MSKLEANSIDAIVTDPPYGLKFMGKEWDDAGDGQQQQEWHRLWAVEALRVLKPGGHLLAFGGSRTYHRLASAVEDAGFEIRDQIMWLYGSGFPKSLNVGKAIDKHGGESVAWFGPWFREWRRLNGVSQKEVARLFPSKTGGLTGCVANWELGFNLPTPDQFNLMRDTFELPFSTIEEAKREVVGTRTTGIGTGNGSTPIMGDSANKDLTAPATEQAHKWDGWGTALKPAHEPIVVARKPLIGTVAANVLEHGTGAINIEASRVEGERWPANIILDEEAGKQLGEPSRFFYCPKAGKKERNAGLDGFEEKAHRRYGDRGQGHLPQQTPQREQIAANIHPTVKPIELMRYLCRLVTPPGGTILDPFLGSGSTGCAAIEEGFEFIGIEREKEYVAICQARLAYWDNQTPN